MVVHGGTLRRVDFGVTFLGKCPDSPLLARYPGLPHHGAHDPAVDNAKPAAKAFKLADGGGLFLVVQPNGSQILAAALLLSRQRANPIDRPLPDRLVGRRQAEARRSESGRSSPAPIHQCKRNSTGSPPKRTSHNTFGVIAGEYIERLEANGAAQSTLKKNRWFLEELCRPISTRTITEITPAEILDLLKRVEKSGRRETARRMRGVIGSVFRLAIVTLRATSDPSYALQGALLKPNTKPRAAITDERQFGEPLARDRRLRRLADDSRRPCNSPP